MKYIIPCLFFLFPSLLMGQNLVPNASFEKFKYCPENFNPGLLEIVEGWSQPSSGTSDYYHACSNNMGIPKNIFGKQMSMEGEGYIGIISYAPSKKNYREYMQTKLLKPLEKGAMYCAEYFVSQAEYSAYLTDGMGMYFSKKPVRAQNNTMILPFTAQLQNPSGHILRNSKTWMRVSDVFFAQGGEQFITIGNFRTDPEITVMNRNLNRDSVPKVWDYSYYYVDNVSLKKVRNREECGCTVDEIKTKISNPGYPWPPFVQFEKMELKSVYFDFDKEVLTKKAIVELEDAIAKMKKYSSYFLEVKGHTDIIGPDGYNSGLSQRRAQAVYDYLVANGIREKRLKMSFFGESQPVEEGESPDANKMNRRVDFELLQF